jgi:hypothetical protein
VKGSARSVSWERNGGPTEATAASSQVSPDAFAHGVLAVLKWEWLDDTFSVEAKRVLPILLLEVYFAEGTDRRISKRQACEIMGVDYAKTGPKYIAQAEARGLIALERRPEEDKRKEYLRPTPGLMTLLSSELTALRHEIGRQRRRSTVGKGQAAWESTRQFDGGDMIRPSRAEEVIDFVEYDTDPAIPQNNDSPEFEPIVRLPSEVGPYARRAAELVEAFHRSTELRPSLLKSIAENLLVSAEFRSDGSAQVAVLGGPWGVIDERPPRHSGTSEFVRDLFLPAPSPIKIIPGTHHYGFRDKVHPDDLQAAQSLTALSRELFAPKRLEKVPGLVPTSNLEGTLVLVGGTTSNAASRLVLEYKQIEREEDGFDQVSDPAVRLRFMPEADRKHALVQIARGDTEPDWGVLDAVTGERFGIDRDAQQRPVTDYLVVTVLPNFLTAHSFARGEKIVIFGGLHGAGTKASALLLEDADLLNRIRASVKEATAWQALIKVSRVEYKRTRPLPVALDRDVRSCVLQVPSKVVEHYQFAGNTESNGRRRRGRHS